MNTFRFVHIGDLHLGPNSRNSDRIAALDQVIAENINEPVAAWLWPGDLNHSRMTIPDGNLLDQRIQRMADHAPVVICYGNHDLPGDLDGFARLHAVHDIHVVSQPQVIRVLLAGCPSTSAAIFCLPYPHRAGLVSAGVQSDQLVDAARQALDVIFMAAAGELQCATAEGCIPLMIGHVNVGGSITSTGQPNIGAEIELDPTLIRRLGNIPVALNHIHKAQFIGGAYYAGSVCRLDWGEVEEKQYLVHSAERVDDDWQFTLTHCPLDVAPMYHVTGELIRDGLGSTGFIWSLSPDVDLPASWEGCEVRVRYRFNAAEKSALDEALVRAPFAGAKRLELDPIAERSRAVRAPEVAAALTLDAKVEAFVRQSGVIWTPGLETKLAALQQPDGAAFLTDISTQLSPAAPAPELQEAL